MDDFKKQWPELLFKLIITIVSILLGATQYGEHREHQQIQFDHALIDQTIPSIEDEYHSSEPHTDYLQEVIQ